MKMEFSKAIIRLSYLIALAITVFVCWATVKGYDVNCVTNICLAVWGEVTVSNGFYYSKAKKENGIKLLETVPDKILNIIDPNNIITQ